MQQYQSVIQLNSISISNSAMCGYCDGKKGQKLWVTSGFFSNRMSIEDYQQLMDRGWRRSGMYYLRPNPAMSCCQAFTLRLNVDEFQNRKMHEKVLKRIQGIKPINFQQELQIPKPSALKIFKEKLQTDIDLADLKIMPNQDHYSYKSISLKEKHFIKKFEEELYKRFSNLVLPAEYKDSHEYALSKMCVYECSLHKPHVEQYDFTFACNFFSLLINKMKVYEIKEKIREQLDELMKGVKFEFFYGGELKNNQFYIRDQETLEHRKLKANIFQLLLTDQNLIDKNKIKKPIQYQIKIEMVKAKFEQESYELYQRYQKKIHGKERSSENQYRSFLCQEFPHKENTKEEIGCWHMKYYLQDELIAVGVVDLLYESLSQVYFFYEPSYKKYSLGVYGTLMEIQYIKERQTYNQYFKYHYMGYYIQDSKKMVYKGEYKKSYLLCPKTYQWVQLDQQLKNKIASLDPNEAEIQLADQCNIIEDMQLEQKEIESIIKQNIRIHINNRLYCVQNLRQSYSVYFKTLFESLLPRIGFKLIQDFIFQAK